MPLSHFLPPFAPQELPCFFTTMAALTPEVLLSQLRYPYFFTETFRPFCRQPPYGISAFISPNPQSHFRGFALRAQARHTVEPNPVHITLRTGRSLPVAPHAPSRKRNYFQLYGRISP